MIRWPFVGWFISLIFSISLAVPFWLCWTIFGLGKVYFAGLPAPWLSIPFWHCVGLMVIANVLASIVKMFFPTPSIMAKILDAT